MPLPEVDLRPVREADIAALAAGMRDQDVAELLALGHEPADFADLLRRSVGMSAMAHAIWSPTGEFMGICGVAPLEQSLLGVSVGSPWMLGTPAVPRFGRALNRSARRYTRAMLALAPVLVNYVHAENSVSVAWLRRLGFTMYPAAPHGPLGALFHRFELTHV